MSIRTRLLKLEAIVKIKDIREIVSYSVVAIDNTINGTGHRFKEIEK